MNKYNYEWTLKDAHFTKDKGKVFSCFACGGGSTMGYKLAGFDVIGCDEIDPKMMEIYKANHNPKYSFLESIRTFKLRTDLPKELYELDILDGSPPCSSFSTLGNRSKDWGKEKKFKEGQALQVLDTLFFDFIDLVNKLQPKVALAENVTGIMKGSARKYVKKIVKQFNDSGYFVKIEVINSKYYGVPQQRERVFFICVRKDFGMKSKYQLFSEINFKMPEKSKPIQFGEINDNAEYTNNLCPSIFEMWTRTIAGNEMVRKSGKKAISHYRLKNNMIVPTMITKTFSFCHPLYPRGLSKLELCRAGSFPIDFDFKKIYPQYVIGMSVPPLLIATIADVIHEQILKND
jgi:DNA (cytosine-5)-methyltransferase 1